MIKKYKLPSVFNVEVVTTHNGKRVGKDFFDDNPSIFDSYPNETEVLNSFIEMKTETSANMISVLEVTENGIIKHLDYRNL